MKMTEIHCLKEGRNCHAGLDRLTFIQQAVSAYRATNPFAKVTTGSCDVRHRGGENIHLLT